MKCNSRRMYSQRAKSLRSDAAHLRIQQALSYLFGSENQLSFSQTSTNYTTRITSAVIHDREGFPFLMIYVPMLQSSWFNQCPLRFRSINGDVLNMQQVAVLLDCTLSDHLLVK